MRRPPVCRIIALLSLLLGSGVGDPLLAAKPVTRIEFLGEARIAGGSEVEEGPVGGLSGITFDEERGVYYVVSDDPSGRFPARFYTVEIDLEDGKLDAGDVLLTGMTVIQDRSGGPMPELTVDPEGIAQFDAETIYISSEGQVRQGVGPFVRRYSLDGTFEMEVQLPDRYSPTIGEKLGPRHNFGFESLTLSPDKQVLFAALENALLQDGPQAALDVGSPSRLLEIETTSGELRAEYLYLTEPLAAPSTVPGGVEAAGLVDLLALDQRNLLAMERSFSLGAGNTVMLFHIDLEGATNIIALPALKEHDLEQVLPVRKELLFDLADLGLYVDNMEGLTLGPILADGRRTLILVSDDNFNPFVQVTQFFAFALSDQATSVGAVQGAGHRSPLEDQWVRGLIGVVTGTRLGEEVEFWIEDLEDDGDFATSRGILVSHPDASAEPAVGDQVEIAGRVGERQRSGELAVTRIEASQVRVVSRGHPLLPAARLSERGRGAPTEVVEDDGLRVFEPQFDGLDYWESLEGMRVVIPDAAVVGPTDRYGSLAIDTSQSAAEVGRTSAGGYLLRPGDFNPELLVVGFDATPSCPQADVGTRFSGDLFGIVDYGFGRYRLEAQPPLPAIDSPERELVKTDLRSGANRLTIATFNVMNLSARDSNERFEAVARTLTANLGSPDIVALQEVQDDSGRTDDGTVTATRTLERLIQAVVEAGGPRYDSRQIDPRNNQDGGMPGANIRVAFLFNPERVESVDRGEAGADDAVQIVSRGSGAALSLSPGRVAPLSPAFGGDEQRGFSSSRKPLAAEFLFGDRRLLLINNHWASKRADDDVFGDVQPPSRHSEDQRSQQARLVADLVREILDREPQAGVLVLGDLNEHEFRSPLRILGSVGLENMAMQLGVEDRYTYNYRGNSQMLDYILVNAEFLDSIQFRVDIVHVNSDFSHETSSSDHDPVVVELTLGRLQ